MPEPLLKKLITKKHFEELLAEEQINPRGQDRADFRSAMICTTIANSFGGSKAKMTDFMPRFDEEKELCSSQDEFDAKMDLWANTMKKAKGGK